MTFVRVCSLSELSNNKPVHVDIDDTPVVIVRDANGVYALHDECSHASIELSEGDVSKGTIECWLHGSRFDLATGKPLSLPATEPVQTYETRIDGDDVLVALGETDA
jgi:3-phenylpropionate/trans-cinnamate dioxygenase ferredoxin subunit